MPEITATKAPIQSRRMAKALFVAARGFVITAAKTFYALWLETTGLVFALFAGVGVSALVRQYRADHLANLRHALPVGGFTLLCAWFTVVSFVRARRTRR